MWYSGPVAFPRSSLAKDKQLNFGWGGSGLVVGVYTTDYFVSPHTCMPSINDKFLKSDNFLWDLNNVSILRKQVLGLVQTCPHIGKWGSFSPPFQFAFNPLVSAFSSTKNPGFQKGSLVIIFFFWNAGHGFRVDRRKRRILNTVMSCIIQRLPCTAFTVYSQEPSSG